jgi:hypothetical protein
MGCNTNTASPTKLSYHNQHSQIYYRSYDNGVLMFVDDIYEHKLVFLSIDKHFCVPLSLCKEKKG